MKQLKLGFWASEIQVTAGWAVSWGLGGRMCPRPSPSSWWLPWLLGASPQSPPPSSRGFLPVGLFCELKFFMVVKYTRHKIYHWDFPGGPVVKVLCFQCRGRGFDPRLGNEDPTCRGAGCGQNQKSTFFFWGSIVCVMLRNKTG